jgi:hypothetical protein
MRRLLSKELNASKALSDSLLHTQIELLLHVSQFHW